jgi:hypothetical protein
MKHPILSVIVLTISGLVSTTHAQQADGVPDGWTKISVCRLSFFAPPDMKDLGMRGIDSCLLQYANKDITVYLDYGRYGSPPRQSNSYLEYKEQSLLIDGKNAQLATFVDAGRSNSGGKYIACMYVVVKESESDVLPKIISLMMSVRGESQKDQEIAQRIFRTIHFD